MDDHVLHETDHPGNMDRYTVTYEVLLCDAGGFRDQPQAWHRTGRDNITLAHAQRLQAAARKPCATIRDVVVSRTTFEETP